jgi:hypothetical protein
MSASIAPSRVPSRRRLRLLAGLAAVLLSVSLTACTGGDDKEKGSAPTPQPSPSVATAKLDVEVARIAGRLPRAKRQRLANTVGATLQRYVDQAFLGEFPRSDFDGAFSTFTRGAAKEAKGDAGLITGAAYSAAESAKAKTLQARLFVLAPRGRSAGATAKVRFTFVYDDTRVTYAGQLLLTPIKGHWRIFGYDLTRNDQPTGATS